MENEKTCCENERSCCCEKTTERTEEERKKLLNRLNRIEGQVRGLKGMIERDAYCADILTQSAAVSAALNGFERDLLSRHMHSCVVRDIKAGKEDVIDELLVLIGKLMK